MDKQTHYNNFPDRAMLKVWQLFRERTVNCSQGVRQDRYHGEDKLGAAYLVCYLHFIMKNLTQKKYRREYNDSLHQLLNHGHFLFISILIHFPPSLYLEANPKTFYHFIHKYFQLHIKERKSLDFPLVIYFPPPIILP